MSAEKEKLGQGVEKVTKPETKNVPRIQRLIGVSALLIGACVASKPPEEEAPNAVKEKQNPAAEVQTDPAKEVKAVIDRLTEKCDRIAKNMGLNTLGKKCGYELVQRDLASALKKYTSVPPHLIDEARKLDDGLKAEVQRLEKELEREENEVPPPPGAHIG